MWGAEDLVASLGGTSSRHQDGRYRDVATHARSAVLLAAGAAGKPAVDTVHLDIADLDGLAAEAEDAVAVGFAATACIHPSQVETVRAAYRPDEAQVAEAVELLEAARAAGGECSATTAGWSTDRSSRTPDRCFGGRPARCDETVMNDFCAVHRFGRAVSAACRTLPLTFQRRAPSNRFEPRIDRQREHPLERLEGG